MTARAFESRVKIEGTQTFSRCLARRYLFESRVKIEGTQTVDSRHRVGRCLRVV